MTHTEPRSGIPSLPEHCRNRPPRSWFVIRHRCHLAKQRLCLATQTTIELVRLEKQLAQSRPENYRQRSGRCRAARSARCCSTPEGHAHSVSCNDSLGSRRIGPQRNIPRRRPRIPGKICCDRLGAHLVASKFSKICSGGGGNSRLSWLSGRKLVAID